MTLNQLLPLVDTLPHVDKFQLMQILLNKLAAEENIDLSASKQAVSAEVNQHASIRDNPGFGMWADLSGSSRDYLQHVRQQQWTR